MTSTVVPGISQGIAPPFELGTVIYYWLAGIATFMFVGAYALYRKLGNEARNIALTSAVLAILAALSEIAVLGNPSNMVYIFTNPMSPIAIDAVAAGLFIVAALLFALFYRKPVAAYLLGGVATLGAVLWIIGRALVFTHAVGRPLWLPASAVIFPASIMLGLAALVLYLQVWKRTPDAVIIHIASVSTFITLYLLLVLYTSVATVAFWGGVVAMTIYAMAYLVYLKKPAWPVVLTMVALALVAGILLHQFIFEIGYRAPLPGEIYVKYQ